MALAALAPPGQAQVADPDPAVLDPVVVTATRRAGRSFDAPAAVDRIDGATIRNGQPQVNLSESLVRVPGIVTLNRQNYAQDLQVSMRGFGARAAFGVRGVRLYQDDIPATMPDGQGQTGSFSLLSADSIEVLRGPASVLYGNAAGGVISVQTEEGKLPPSLTAIAGAGSFGARTLGLKAGGRAGALGYVLAGSRFETTGYRYHSAAQRNLVNAKLTLAAGADTRITLVGSLQEQRKTQDPLGLTRAQWEADPRQADPAAAQFDTSKTIRQEQGGASIEQRLGRETTLRLTGYGGRRAIRQNLALAGSGETASGGIVDLDREFGGIGVRLTRAARIADRPLVLTVGADSDRQRERRLGFVNRDGAVGNLRRDEDDFVAGSDAYAQLEWSPLDALSLTAGIRYADVRFRSEDHYVTAANGDDSGRRDFSHVNPVLGAVWHLAPDVNAYASVGEGFETPTFAELAYRPNGPGLNFALAAATSRAAEAGLKIIAGRAHRINVAAFVIRTRDEIVIDTAAGGRTTFRNAGATRRNGVEAVWDGRWPLGFTSRLAWTYIAATFANEFRSGTPAVTVPAGARLPGVPASSAYGELAWAPGGAGGLQAAVEVTLVDRIFINDRNSDAAPRYAVVGARVGLEQRFAGLTLREFVRVDNLADRRYAGSVIVGDANGRSFEPAPGRNWSAGVTLISTF
ncbi:MAG: TonB-dependent receptor [Betaproteobacteria bacterium]|nr:TonB-dependent receptor [Betaproteobacteria bacterium]